MTVFEISSMAVALFSLCISLFVILRDRHARRIELLIRCYSRLTDEHNKRPPIPLPLVGVEAEADQDRELSIMKEQSHDVSFNVERELNTTCYLLLKGQLPKRMFYDLFGTWLMGRDEMWKAVRKDLIQNQKYTWRAIQYYKRKGYFLKRSQRLQASTHKSDSSSKPGADRAR